MNSNESALVVYGDIELSVLQMMACIEEDEETNRKTEMLQIKDDASKGVSPPSTGGVYIAYSECLGCMKIGATRRSDPLNRLREISRYTTTPFRLVAWRPSARPFNLEAVAHFHFRKQRINTRGAEAGTEFFHISAAEAAEWVDQAQDDSVSTGFNGRKSKASGAGARAGNNSKKAESSAKDESNGSNTKKRKAPSGHIEIDGTTFQTRLQDFFDAHIKISRGNFLPTRQIRDAFFADPNNGNSDDSIVSDCVFQKILKQYTLDIFAAQSGPNSGVSYGRSSINGERAWGYTGLSLF